MADNLLTRTPAQDPAVPDPRWRARGRRLLTRWEYGFVGLAGATAFFCLSLTPSLLPRSSLVQGVLSGVLAATGYGLGVLAVWLVRQFTHGALPHPSRTAWRVLGGAALVAAATSLYLGSAWQRDVHRLVGLDPPPRFGFPIVLLVAALTGAAIVGAVRILRRAVRRAAGLLGRWVPAATARVLAGVVVAALLVGVLNGVVLRGSFAVADSAFSAVNGEIEPAAAAPRGALRSGGPGSLVSWASLGNQGRRFVSGGPDAGGLRAFAGAQATEPVRVYVGLDAADTSRERAALAVAELQRTEAFGRAVLCVITTTGTGWVNDQAVDALEYMYGGDSALVSTQYSYLPSWISFLVDKERARAAGRDLFNAVYAVWSQLPAGGRPRLLVFGESLGSFGAESAFSGTDDIRNRTDGMLLVGPPNRNGLWSELVEDRDPGSPAVLPTYEGGATVRFSARARDLARPGPSGERPGVVYLQHASDPITWWSPALLVRRPDWLAEPRGDDVSPRMRWLPFVTFWQVTADMAISTTVPAGHGHRYGTAPAVAWAHIAPPDGWTPQRTDALAALIAASD